MQTKSTLMADLMSIFMALRRVFSPESLLVVLIDVLIYVFHAFIIL
jgi:hypothetical protein